MTSAVSAQPAGRHGGRLVVALRSEPRTLNPVTAADGPSRDVIGRLTADLIHINRDTQLTEPALAQSWSVSPDGRQYTLRLREGVRFSDGAPFGADDVLFTFRVLLGRTRSRAAARPAGHRRQAADRREGGQPHGPVHACAALRRRGTALRQHGDTSQAPPRAGVRRRPVDRGLGARHAAGRHRRPGPFPAGTGRPGRADRARAQSALLENGSCGQSASVRR